jgi:hypothetical protein
MVKPIPHYFRAGYIAGKSGIPATGNPMLFKGWPWHAWRLGQEYGELEAKVNATDNDNNVGWDDHLERASKAPAAQGQVAHANGLYLEDCPYDPGSPDWTQWRRGWSLANNKEWNESVNYRRWAVFGFCALAFIAYEALMWAIHG